MYLHISNSSQSFTFICGLSLIWINCGELASS